MKLERNHSINSYQYFIYNNWFYFSDCLFTLVVRCRRGLESNHKLVVLNLCLERLHHVSISYDKACSNR